MPLEDDFVLASVAQADKPPLSVFSVDIPDERYSQFNVSDLLGETITGYRRIKNPNESNSDYFHLVEFQSGNFLVSEEEGWQDGTTMHWYYHDGRSTKYSDRLFSGD